MQVSFIIPLYNGLALTRECLRTLQATIPAGLTHEIVLVDDGSSDGTREWLATLAAPCRVLLNEKNLGFAGACNRGAAAAQGEYLAFINSDLVLAPNWLEPMLAVLATHSNAGLVGNVQYRVSDGALDHAGVQIDHKGKPRHVRELPRHSGPVLAVPAVTGACFIVTHSLFSELGCFDEAYLNGCEDIDLCFRALQAGRQNYVALTSVIQHHVSASRGRSLRDERNARRLFSRWPHLLARLGAPAWCRNYLTLDPALTIDDRIARQCLWHVLGLTPLPAAALNGMHAALLAEQAHWRELLGPEPEPLTSRP